MQSRRTPRARVAPGRAAAAARGRRASARRAGPARSGPSTRTRPGAATACGPCARLRTPAQTPRRVHPRLLATALAWRANPFDRAVGRRYPAHAPTRRRKVSELAPDSTTARPGPEPELTREDFEAVLGRINEGVAVRT